MLRLGRCGWLLFACLACAILPPISATPQTLYNQELDDLAQKAQKAAAEIRAATFDKQLKNLDLIVKQDFALYFLDARRSARSKVNSMRSWVDVLQIVDDVDKTLTAPGQGPTDAELKEKRTKLATKIDEVKGTIKTLETQGARDDPALTLLFDRVSDLTATYDLGTTLLDGEEQRGRTSRRATTLSTVDQIVVGLDGLNRLYNAYAANMKRLAAIDDKLAGLKIQLQKVALQALEVEVQHTKAIVAIRARREILREDIRDLVTDVRALVQRVAVAKDEEVFATLVRLAQAGDSENLASAFQALFSVTALAVRGNAPDQIAQLRLSQAEHRYSIRKSAVTARAYETVLGTGTQRLALYYGSGIKPETIAQLIQAAATAAVPPAILLR